MYFKFCYLYEIFQVIGLVVVFKNTSVMCKIAWNFLGEKILTLVLAALQQLQIINVSVFLRISILREKQNPI